uniref:Uncharacterized protein n=1 Tax=Saimiri boliviensis boliviensis TaxID=39432 RepID=A0A2K6UD66_SAIBB
MLLSWPVKIASLLRFGLAPSTSTTALKMSLLKKEVSFSDCPYGEIKIKFKETNDTCWHFLMHSCIFVMHL